LMGGLSNGWDQDTDTNDTKTVMLYGAYKPSEQFNAALTIYHGPEGQYENEQLTSIDFVATYKHNEDFNVDFQFNRGSQERNQSNDPIALGGAVREDFTWMGLGIWPEFRFDKFTLGARLQYLSDDDNNLITNINAATEVTYVDIAITPSVQLTETVQLRGELRYTSASEDVYTDEDGAADDKNMTVALEAVWKF
jgi:hypothetical protein